MGNTNQGICGLLNPHLMPDRTPGLLGRRDAADPNSTICLAGDTPGPAGTNGDKSAVNVPLRPKRTIHTLDLSLSGLAEFFHSVATAVAIDKLTIIKGGVKLPDPGTGPFMTISKAIVLAVAPGKTVETASQDELEKEVNKLVSDYTQQFLKAMDGGVPMLLFSLEQKKIAAVNSMKKKFEDALEYNNEKIKGINDLLKGAIAIKFASTVFVKTASKFVPFGGTAIDLAYDVSLEATKGMNGDPKASLVRVITEEGSKEVAEELLTEEAKKVTGKRFGEEQLKAELSKLERQMEEKLISSKKLRNHSKKISRTSGELDKVSSKVKWAGRGVGFLFWMNDMREAWETLQEDLDSVK